MHVITGLSPDGAENMLKRLIESKPSSIPDTVVVSLTSLDVIGESLRVRGVNVHALRMSSVLHFPAALLQLITLIRRYRPDIIQTWMYHADLLGGLAGYLAGNRKVIWGIRIARVPKNNLRTIFVMKVCAWLSCWIPSKIVCVAESAKKEHSRYGYDVSRMVVIPNGFDFSCLTATSEERRAFRQRCCFGVNDLVIGCMGRFHPEKGQDNFVKAAAIVAHDQKDARFLLVGRGCDADNAELTGWIKTYGLQDRFVLLGERRDIPACLAAMDIYCMPSSNEGFPNSLGEAMAMGLPCVATDVGDARVLTGDTAVLVPAQDERSLAAGLLQMVDLSDEQRHQIGQRAKARVMAEFSMTRARQRFDAVYHEITSEIKASCVA